MKSFVVWADTRTGSSSLANVLHSVYNSYNENTQEREYVAMNEPYNLTKLNSRFPNLFNKYLVCAAKKHDVRSILELHDTVMSLSYGYKHIWSHLTVSQNFALLHTIINSNIPVIFLTRENIPKKCLSLLLARSSGVWGMQNNPNISYSDLIIDDNFMSELNNVANLYVNKHRNFRQFLSIYDNVFYVTYNDIYNTGDMSDRLNVLTKMIEFLDMDTNLINESKFRDYISPKKRQNPVDTIKTIPNIDKVERWAQKKYKCSIFKD